MATNKTRKNREAAAGYAGKILKWKKISKSIQVTHAQDKIKNENKIFH